MKGRPSANVSKNQLLRQAAHISDPPSRSETFHRPTGRQAKGTANLPRYNPSIFRPWRHGANNDAIKRSLEFTGPEADDLADFHGDPRDPKLALYVAGNSFFAMAPSVRTIELEYRQYRGRLYWETIPPGLLVQQIQAGGTVTCGNMTWTVKADCYFW